MFRNARIFKDIFVRVYPLKLFNYFPSQPDIFLSLEIIHFGPFSYQNLRTIFFTCFLLSNIILIVARDFFYHLHNLAGKTLVELELKCWFNYHGSFPLFSLKKYSYSFSTKSLRLCICISITVIYRII